MAFPIPLTSKMSGATPDQLRYWRTRGILRPEIEDEKSPYLYSFRDIVALRTLAWLRGDHSLQMIRRAFSTLSELDMVEHPASYTLVKLGKSIGVVDQNDPGQAIDLVREPGQITVGTLEDVFARFESHNRRVVDPLLHPRDGVEVNPSRLGGWPTITGTRVPFDVVASLIGDGSVPAEDVAFYYPDVSPQAARDALDFQRSIVGEAA